MPIPLILAAAAGGAILGAAKKGEGKAKAQQNRTAYYQQPGYDQEATLWGGSRRGFNDYIASKGYQRQIADQREANLANYGGANDWEEASKSARSGQSQAASLMMNRAWGATPSIAGQQANADMLRVDQQRRQQEAMLQQQGAEQRRQLMASQGAQQASARGGAGLALASQTAANNTANGMGAISSNQMYAQRALNQGSMDAMANISNQAQVNAANERLQAENAAFGAYGSMRGADMGAQGMDMDQAQFQANQLDRNRAINDARAMGYEQIQAQAYGQDQQARVANEGIKAGSFNTAQGLNAGAAQFNAARDKGWVESITDGAKEGVSMGQQTSDAEAKNTMDMSTLAAMAPYLQGSSAAGVKAGAAGAGGASLLSDTRAKEAAILEKGRREGIAQAQAQQTLTRGPTGPGPGDPNAPQAQFDPRRGWYRPGDVSDAGDSMGKDALDDWLGYQVEQDRSDAAIDDRLAAQAAEDERRKNDPAVGLGRAPKGYARQRMSQPGGSMDSSAVENDAQYAGLAPGTADFERTAPKKQSWWTTPIWSDARAKRDAFQEGVLYAEAQKANAATMTEDGLKGEVQGLPDYMRGAPPPNERPRPEKQWKDPTPAQTTRATLTAQAQRNEPQRRAGETSGAKGLVYTGPEVAPAMERNIPHQGDPIGQGALRRRDADAQVDRERAANVRNQIVKMGLDDGPKGQPGTTAALDKGPVAAANRTLAGQPYTYKAPFVPPSQKPGEINVGPMAQNLETSPVAATAVKIDPATGMRMIDRDKALKVAMTGIADLQKQQDETRAMLGKGRKPAKKGK